MTIDQTFNFAVPTSQLRIISSGCDGEALIGVDDAGRYFELRVLLSQSDLRVDEIRRQLALVTLADHPCIRNLLQPLSDNLTPAFRLSVPAGVDALNDRLSRRLDGLQPAARLRIAALLVEVCESAHHIGLCHGSFAASTILIGSDESNLQVHVDYSSMACSDDVIGPQLSVESDLKGLHRLLAELLEPVLASSDESGLEELSGRNRAVLRQWIKQLDDGDGVKVPPTLGQWRPILAPFLPDKGIDQNITFDQTGIIAIPSMPIDFSGTSGIQTNHKTTHPPVDTIPQTLGRFRIESKIGEGGMGVVYRGVDPTSGQAVAVKVLRQSGKDLGQSIRRFRKEARLLQDVQNEYVTRLIEVGEDAGLHYLVMEFVDGIDLKTWLANRSALPESEAIELMIDLTRSLVDAHASEVIHRDIKPENVLLKLRPDAAHGEGPMVDRPISDFTLKLSDFGIARHVSQSESLEMTRAGSVMGTPKYMAPEQCKSAVDLTPSADIYSLGVTLFELLTGGVPYESNDFMKIAAMHCFDPIPAVQKRNARISDTAQRIVYRALAKNPADRFGDASQMLAELLRLKHGDPAQWDVHPKLPKDHDGHRVWEKTVTWELESRSADLWPLVSNTERLNEAIGLPPVQYRTEHDPHLGTRRFGSFTVSGLKVCWEEHPFEWIEGQRMGVLREFSSGPLRWYMSVVSLESIAGGGTRLSHQLRVESRNLLGRVLTKLKMDREGFRNLERVYRRIDQSIVGKLAAQRVGDPFAESKPLTRARSVRLSQAIEQIIQAGADVSAAAELKTAIQTWSPQELASLRPLAIADRLGINGSVMIDTCLLAAHCGILNLHWEVLCPTCRLSADTKDELSQIGAHTNCEACDIDFQSNLASAIEIVFQVHPEIRDVNTRKYCIGGPAHSPHVVAQIRVDAGERLDVPLDLPVGNYLVRGQRLPRTQNMIIRSTAAPSSVQWVLSSFGTSNCTPTLRAGRQTITITNDLDTLHIVRIERTIPRGDVVTAATASTHPLFRRLFPNQRFREDNPIATETMTFLTSGINNVEPLYKELGDTDAYAAIHSLHAEITDYVSGAGGSVVKTIGERLLAVFDSREAAVAAALRMRGHLNASAKPFIELGIGIHCGPTLVTTQNHQLDYFGGTVRAASGLPDHAGKDTLITETVYADPGVAGQLDPLNILVEMIDLPGHPQMRVKRIAATEKSP